MNKYRKRSLELNFPKMFWIQAFLQLKVINVVLTLFYIHRGLNMSEVLLMGVIWSLVTILFEVPSSYLADRWGRKNTIILACVFACIHWMIMIYSHSFLSFGIALFFLSLSSACISGTDEALIYDSVLELGVKKNSLEFLGKYFSSRRIFKIFTPIIAVVIAKNLSEEAFVFLLSIDVFATIIGFFIACTLVEPSHFEDEFDGCSLLSDAWKLIWGNFSIVRVMFGKACLFCPTLIMWRFHQKFFLEIGATVLSLGIMISIFQIISYYINRNIHSVYKEISLHKRINVMGFGICLGYLTYLMFYYMNIPVIIFMIIYILINCLETSRWPLFSEYYNQMSQSSNRATTLSLASFMDSIMSIPLTIIMAYLVAVDYGYLFLFFFLICLISVLFLRAIPLQLKKEQ